MPVVTRKTQMQHKTEIEIELSETIAYKRPIASFESFCPVCKSLVEMAPPEAAAILTRTTEREIYRLVETNLIHFVETDKILVCLNSLAEIKSATDVMQNNYEKQNNILFD